MLELSWNMDQDGVAQIFSPYNFEKGAKHNNNSVADVFRNKVHAGGHDVARQEQIHMANLFTKSPRLLEIVKNVIFMRESHNDAVFLEFIEANKAYMLGTVWSIEPDFEPKLLAQCDICGDHHEPGDIPRECETGDGV